MWSLFDALTPSKQRPQSPWSLSYTVAKMLRPAVGQVFVKNCKLRLFCSSFSY